MKKWILIAVAVVISVPLAFTVLGFFVSETHTASSRVRLKAEPETVWALVSNFEGWPEWSTAFHTVEKQPDRDGVAYWIAEGGFGEVPMLVTVHDPPRRLVTKIPEDADIGFGGTWTYAIEAAGTGSVLTVTEDGTITNPFFRAVSRFIVGYHTGVEGFLVDAAAELGEELEPERVSE